MDKDVANVIIRGEEPEERGISDEIILQAYGRDNEARLAQALRRTAEFNPDLSIVADREGKLLGYALYSRATVVGEAGVQPVLVLGPIGVRPDFQRQGVGERLVRHGLERCRSKGVELVFVIGLPAYFSRLGFRPAIPLGLQPELPVSPQDFLVIDLGGRHLGTLKGQVAYPAPFKALT